MLSTAKLEELQVLVSFDDAALKLVIKAAMEFLQGGENAQYYAALVERLKKPEEVIRTAVEVVSFLYSEGAKLKSSDKDFRDSLVTVGISDSARDLLWAGLQACVEAVRQRQEELSFRPVHFVDLQWRLDVELASRTLRQQITPTYLLRLTTENETGKEEQRDLQTDPVTLKYMYDELTAAFAEERAAYAKRIQRNVK